MSHGTHNTRNYYVRGGEMMPFICGILESAMARLNQASCRRSLLYLKQCPVSILKRSNNHYPHTKLSQKYCMTMPSRTGSLTVARAMGKYLDFGKAFCDANISSESFDHGISVTIGQNKNFIHPLIRPQYKVPGVRVV